MCAHTRREEEESGDEKTKKIPLTFSWQTRIVPESRDQYNQGIFTNERGWFTPGMASRPILWKLLTARLLCRTVYNPRNPAVNIKNTPCICCVAQSNSAPASLLGREISDGNSSGRPPRFFLFFFFFSSVCPALPHVFTFPLGFAGSIRCHYTPHKAARHRPGRSSATARNSEIIGIVVEAGVTLFAVSEQHAKFFTFLFLFYGSVINMSKLINRGIDFKEKGGVILLWKKILFKY